MINIKNCPKCGSDKVEVEKFSGLPICKECGLVYPIEDGETTDQALEKWNEASDLINNMSDQERLEYSIALQVNRVNVAIVKINTMFNNFVAKQADLEMLVSKYIRLKKDKKS